MSKTTDYLIESGRIYEEERASALEDAAPALLKALKRIMVEVDEGRLKMPAALGMDAAAAIVLAERGADLPRLRSRSAYLAILQKVLRRFIFDDEDPPDEELEEWLREVRAAVREGLEAL